MAQCMYPQPYLPPSASGKDRTYPTLHIHIRIHTHTLHLSPSLPPSPLPSLLPTYLPTYLHHPRPPANPPLTTHQMSRERPVERCPECGGVYRMEYIGPPDDPHAHHGHGEEHGDHSYHEPKTFADYVRPEYRGTPQPLYGQS